MKLFRRIILIAAALCLAVAALIYANIYRAENSVPEKSDVIIVLGCQIRGNTPSPLLEYRLQKAYELYMDGYAQFVIVSGGQGWNEITSESNIMKAWLENKGIDKNKIFEEDKSTSTYENLKFSLEIMRQNNLKTAIVVSNDFHIFRALMLAKRLDIKASGAPAPTVKSVELFYSFREILSVVKSFIVDR